MAPKPIDVTLQGRDNTKPAFDSAQKNAEGFGAKLTETLNKPFDLLKGLIAVEMVRLFGEFAKSSVEAAAESEAAWSRVAQSVENAGITFAGVKNQLQDTFEKVSEGTRFTETEVTDAFGTLLNVTNDYAGSVKQLALVTDVAVARHLDLNTAATLVGRVMDGNTSMLKRYGIVIKDGVDAMEALHQKFDGFSERDSQTLEGRLKAVSKEFEELKIKIGGAITGGDGFSKTSNVLVDSLKHLGDWIDKNKGNIAEMVTLLGRLSEYTLKGLSGIGAEYKGANKGLWASLTQMPFKSLNPADATHGPVTFENHSGTSDPVTVAQQAANAAKVAADRQAISDAAADKALTKRIEDLKKEADLLLKSLDLTTLTAADEKRIGEAAVDLFNTSRDMTKSLRERTAAAEQLHRIAEADKKISDEVLKNEKEIAELSIKGISLGALQAKGASALLADRRDLAVNQGVGATTRSANAPNIGFRATAALPVSVGTTSSFGAGIGTNLQELLGGPEAFKNVDTSLGTLDDHLKSLAAGGVNDLFGAWQAGINAVIQGHEKMSVVIPRVMRQAVGGALAADAQDTLLRAAKALALGLTDPTGIHFAQAGKLFAVGTAELAAAAALSGGGGGGGNYGGGVSAGSFQQTQGQIGGQGKVTVILPGKKTIIDTTNPDDLNALRDAIQTLVGTRDLEFLVGDAA